MADLYPLFFENLRDAISSVRQGAALALANVVRAYGQYASFLGSCVDILLARNNKVCVN